MSVCEGSNRVVVRFVRNTSELRECDMNKITNTAVMMGLMGLASFASAQSQTHTSELAGDYLLNAETVSVNGDLSSIVVLLNPPAEQTQGRFADFGFEGSDDYDTRGRNMTGINGRQDFTPKQDDLNVVPLPPATFAGFGLLAGLAGVRYMRKSRR